MSFHCSGINGLRVFHTGQWTCIAGTTLVWTVVILNSSETSGQKGGSSESPRPPPAYGPVYRGCSELTYAAQLQEVQHSVVQCWLLNTVLLTSWSAAYSLSADFTAVKLNYIKRGLPCKLGVNPWFFFFSWACLYRMSLEEPAFIIEFMVSHINIHSPVLCRM